MFNEELKKKIHNVLKDKANFVSFAFGHKFTAGKNTKQFSILVFVSKKDANVAEKDRIPDTIEGYPTDVQLYQSFVPLTVASNYHCIQCEDLLGKTPTTCTFTDQTTTTTGWATAHTVTGLRHRQKFNSNTPGNNYNKPQIAGGMTGTASSSACTITLVAQDAITQELVILGNQHCLPFVTTSQLLNSVGISPDTIVNNTQVTSAVANKVMRQGETSSPNIVGTFYKTNYQPANTTGATAGLPCTTLGTCYKADVAVYKVAPNMLPMQGIVDLGDGPFEWMTKEDFCELYCGSPDCSDCVGNTIYAYKSGRTTGTQTPQEGHIIVAVDLDASIVFDDVLAEGYRKYKGIISIQHENDADIPFGGGGDSGSPVLVEHDGKLKVLGMLSWGNNNAPIGDLTPPPATSTPAVILIAPIWQIAEAVAVKSWNYTQQTGAGEIIVNSDEPTITVSGRTYVKGSETSLPITHVKDN